VRGVVDVVVRSWRPVDGDAETGGLSAEDVFEDAVADVRDGFGGDVGGAGDGLEEFLARFFATDVGGDDDGVEFVAEAEGVEKVGESKVPIGGDDDANAGAA